MADHPACFFLNTRGSSAVFFGGCSRGSTLFRCAAVNLFPSLALQINFLSHSLLHLIFYEEPSPPPPQVSSPHPTSTPTRPPRPDNDVLITRLLGRKIALILIHMQGNICHRLGVPSPPTTVTLCVCQAG